MGKTLFEKIWDAHVIAQDEGAPAVLYIDAHLVHEVTSPQAFATLRERGLPVRRPDKTFATIGPCHPHANRGGRDGLAGRRGYPGSRITHELR